MGRSKVSSSRYLAIWLVMASVCMIQLNAMEIKLSVLTAQSGKFICCETYAPTQQLFYCVYGNQPNFKTVSSFYSSSIIEFINDFLEFYIRVDLLLFRFAMDDIDSRSLGEQRWSARFLCWKYCWAWSMGTTCRCCPTFPNFTISVRRLVYKTLLNFSLLT